MSVTTLKFPLLFAILLGWYGSLVFAVCPEPVGSQNKTAKPAPSAEQTRQDLEKAEALLKKRSYGEASDAFRSVLNVDPRNTRALYGSALALFNLHRLDEAEPEAKAAVDILVPQVLKHEGQASSEERLHASDALVLQAVIQAVRGNNAAALRSAELATKISPSHFDAQFTYGRALFGVGDAAEAIKVFRKSVMLRPKDTQALFFLGTALERTGDLENAIKAYREIIANNPEAPEGHLGVGILLVRRAGSEGDEGIAELERALKIDRSLYEAEVAVGRAYLTRGKLNQAVDHLVRAVELNPRNPEPHYQLSLAYRRLGLTEKAEQESDTVRRIHEARRTPNSQSSTAPVPRVAN